MPGARGLQRLPGMVIQDRLHPVEGKPSGRYHGSDRRVLLALSDVHNRSDIARLLRSRGLLVLESNAPLWFRRTLSLYPERAEEFDVVVVELRFPGGSASQVLGLLELAASPTRCLVLDNVGSGESHGLLRKQGAAEVLHASLPAAHIATTIVWLASSRDRGGRPPRPRPRPRSA